MSTENEGPNDQGLNDDSTQSFSNTSIKTTPMTDEYVEKSAASIDLSIEELVAEVKPDVPYESPPEPTEIKVFGRRSDQPNEPFIPKTLLVPGGNAPKEIDVSVMLAQSPEDIELEEILADLGPETVDPNTTSPTAWFTPEQFAKRVQETQQWVSNLRTIDEARSKEVIRRVSQIMKDINNPKPINFSELRKATAAKEEEDMIKLMRRLNEIHFTEEEALIAGNLLAGHASWKIWYENGEWKVIETKEKDPQFFPAIFKHAAGAMKMNSLLNQGKTRVDPEVLAVIGACKRLDDIVEKLPEPEKSEYTALMNYLNQQ